MALLLKNLHLVDPHADINEVCDVVIRDGRFVEFGKDLSIPKGVEFDCSGKVGIPSLVDMHGHLREPGYEYKETIESGARSALKGGYSDICCMPNTLPVADTSAVIKAIIKKAEAQDYCRVHPFGAITVGLEGSQLTEMADLLDAGAIAFSDDGKGVQSAKMMRTAFDYAKMFDALLVAHSEDESLAGKGCVHEGKASTLLGLPGQPGESETVAVLRDIALAELTGGRLHIAHVSSRHTVEAIRQAKARGVAITAEVTPHHLFLSEENLDTSYNTNLKVNPPLRSEQDRAALVEGLLDGTLDVVATDHASHASEEKECEFELAAFGSIGYETALPLVLTNLVNTEKMSYERLVEVMSHKPREILGLPPRVCEVGAQADLTLFDPAKNQTFEVGSFTSHAQNSAFIGQPLTGAITDVIINGYHKLQDGKVIA